MRSYMVKYKENGIHKQSMVSDLAVAKKLADEKDGKIFITDGKYTKSLDGIDVNHPNED